MNFPLFKKLARKTSFTFSIVFFSTLWVYPAASYGFYIFYATADMNTNEFNFALAGLALGIVLALFTHFVHYGIFHRLGISGFTRSNRNLNRYLSDDRAYDKLGDLDRSLVDSLYNDIVLLPRNNLIAASGYTVLVIVLLLTGYYFLFVTLFKRYFYLIMGGTFTVLIHGYFVYNFTEYLIGPYKSMLERILFRYETDFRNRYQLSVRNKSLFAIMLIFFSMIILAIFIITSEKPLLQIFIFIALCVISIGLLIFMSINKVTISLMEINTATKDLASGGSGLFFPQFLDREVVTFSYHYNRAAMEINEIRSNLEHKVKARTEELTKAYDKLNAVYKQIRDDLQLAKKIQNRILPANYDNIKGIRAYIQYYPMSEIGGDIYDITEIKPRYIRILIADAAGHGVQAALVTMIIKSEYEKVKYFDSPALLLENLNNSFLDLYEILSVFFSCAVIDLDLDNRRMLCSSAGHPDQIHISGNSIEKLRHTGKLVGIVKDTQYQVIEREFHDRDKLLLFTDGLYEQFDEREEVFGEDNLFEVVRSYTNRSIEDLMYNIISEVDSFVGGKNKISLHDDVTVIGIEIDLNGN